MKRTSLLALMVVLAYTSAAQGFQYGIKGGINLAKLKVSVTGLSASTDNLVSFHAGFYGVLMTSEKFGIQPELLYSGQGGAGSGGSGDFALGYLSIPVMLRYEFTPGVTIQAGPQVGFLLSANVDGQDAKSGMNTTDFSLGFGLGVDRPSGVNFGFRYVVGLSNTLSDETTGALVGFGFPGVSMTNQVMQFSVGYRLSKGTGN